ncbi:MAG: DUF4249 domain-containing protein [Reichenbachiella sp.]|uniref:DUF4249 domain-containing protein n=1 Tax=Reichenbachiella sp. TaxID=2184521 RepID=UPI002966F116|nr:DUF4249 domain-containing protein [Reichenbachiella sp.]MDW3210630.1 DUF4249 domain-containing protein [Reichenbachiella sp.]
MKNNIIRIIIGMACGLFLSCTEEITLDIPLGKERLVIDGGIEVNKETSETIVEVKLSTTTAYFDDTANPALTADRVAIYDESDQEYLLTETTKGIYSSDDITALVDETYRLVVNWNGVAYEAESTLQGVPALQEVYQISQEATFFDDAGIKLALDFQDPVDEENYYHFEQYRNDTLLLTPSGGNQFQLVVKDEFFNGQFIEAYVPGDEFSFLPDDMGRIKMRSLDQKAFEFYKLFYEKSVDEPSFIVGETPPVAIKGNVINTAEPDNYALGYFLATQVSIGATKITSAE